MSNKDIESKIAKYIDGLKYVLDQIRDKRIEKEEVRKIVDLAEKYFEDAKYYLKKGDYFTSLICVVYAEGLIDSLRFMGEIDYLWKFEVPKASGKKVVAAGTFDLIHPGHLWFLRKASEYGRLTVIVARDKTVKKIKGHPPVIPEDQRLLVVQGLKYVDEAVLGFENDDLLKIIEKLKPDILVLGPDQNFIPEEELKRKLRERGLKTEVVKLREQFNKCKFYKTSDIVREIKRKAYWS